MYYIDGGVFIFMIMNRKNFFVAVLLVFCGSISAATYCTNFAKNVNPSVGYDVQQERNQDQGLPIATLSVSNLPPVNAPVSISITPSSGCEGFYVECLPTTIAKMIPNDDVLYNYLNNKKARLHKESFKDKSLLDLGFVLNNNTEYTVLVLAMGEGGEIGSSASAEFNSGELPVKGHPMVDSKVVSVGTDSVSIIFTPNADVAGYALCMFPKDAVEEELKTHGQTMGLTTVADMVKRFSGKMYREMFSKTWKGLAPNTPYDFCVQAWDKNGRFVSLQKAVATTAVLGGSGVAAVNMEIGEFGGSVSTGYYQIVTYIPNDQAAVHRDIIITEEAFNQPDMGEAGVIKMLQEEHPNDPYWNQYGVDKAQWNAEPGKVYYACSIARNADGKWGKLHKVRFVTPQQ